GPITTLVGTVPNLAVADAAVENVAALEAALDKSLSAGFDRFTLSRSFKEIAFEDVVFHYHDTDSGRAFTVGPINLTFKPGETVFIAGGNGSGKTTLAKLLVGLYEPESGEIRFAGRRITAENRHLLREHFSVVFADFFLFERLLGLDRPVLDDEALRYLRELRLERKVRVEEGFLSTLDLSQGQRKRLALLTAYLEDRPLYLFDEWAADQDPTFKEIFYLEILPGLKAKAKTVFVISHDDRYYQLADRIIKLEDGKVEFDRPISEYLALAAST
ncbi:MAG TPA: cyclic peptide export ABC transporter, partial [Thermoanaerobaculia bacterium]|nr:cyclic peptide export ABC transporter [Thermoanaerobaculia bacterium]